MVAPRGALSICVRRTASTKLLGLFTRGAELLASLEPLSMVSCLGATLPTAPAPGVPGCPSPKRSAGGAAPSGCGPSRLWILTAGGRPRGSSGPAVRAQRLVRRTRLLSLTPPSPGLNILCSPCPSAVRSHPAPVETDERCQGRPGPRPVRPLHPRRPSRHGWHGQGLPRRGHQARPDGGVKLRSRVLLTNR